MSLSGGERSQDCVSLYGMVGTLGHHRVPDRSWDLLRSTMSERAWSILPAFGSKACKGTSSHIKVKGAISLRSGVHMFCRLGPIRKDAAVSRV